MSFHRSVMAAAVLGAMSAGAVSAESHTGGDMEIAGDAEAGERVFRKCMACHAVGEGAENKVGPMLNGIVGREVASVEDYQYSSAMTEKAAEIGTWSSENLHAYLENPRQYVPGTKMSFPGLRKEEDRDDVVAYLATFSE